MDDTTRFFLPAALAILSGRSPYEAPGFYNPPWVLLLFVPFVTARWAVWAVRALNLAAFVVLARRAGSWVAVAALVLSAPVLFSLFCANIDGLALLGLYWGGSLLLSVKPQLTAGVMAYDALHGRLPAWGALGYGLSMLVYGAWPLQVAKSASFLHGASWDHSLWPWGLLLGAPLLAWAIWTHRRDVALACSPLLSPYVGGGSWCGLTLLLAGQWPWALLAVDVGLLVWGVTFIL